MSHYHVDGNKWVGIRRWGMAAILMVFAVVGIYLVIATHHKTPTALHVAQTTTQATQSTSTNQGTISGKYLFSGTVMLGRAVETYANGNYDQPFSGMASLGTYDAHIGVFECPVTTNNVSYQTEVDRLIFNCKPSWLPTLAKYFPILSLSSDHLNDQGPDGIVSTFKYLKAAGIQTAGTFNPHSDSEPCKPVLLPVHVTGQANSSVMPVALCSYNYKIIYSPNPGELEKIQTWSKIMPVIAMMNGGPEYQHQASTSQTSVAHIMIDYGADYVVGNGTHWAQNTEVYKGKLIVYSMGNFIFDQLDYDGRIALNLSVAMNIPLTSDTQKWLDIGKQCQAANQDCSALISNQQIPKVQPTYTFDVVGSYGGYKQVATRANAQQQKDIEQRANWQVTKQQLTSQAN